MSDEVYSGKKAPEVLDYLLKRRSLSVKFMDEPGPSPDEIDTILKAAMRVPDHGRMFPWYFLVFDGEARKQVGEGLRQSWLVEDPEATEAKLELEAERFLRAPLVVGVISRIRQGKHPQWEQILSAGSVCQNLSLAAHALGYASNWLTEWYSYNETFRAYLGLGAQDHVAGFVYIGTPVQQPEERERPDPAKIITRWSPGCNLNKGDQYEQPKLGYPSAKFQTIKDA